MQSQNFRENSFITTPLEHKSINHVLQLWPFIGANKAFPFGIDTAKAIPSRRGGTNSISQDTWRNTTRHDDPMKLP